MRRLKDGKVSHRPLRSQAEKQGLSDLLLDDLLNLAFDFSFLMDVFVRPWVQKHTFHLVMHLHLGSLFERCEGRRSMSSRFTRMAHRLRENEAYLVSILISLVGEGESIAFDKIRGIFGIEVDGENCSRATRQLGEGKEQRMGEEGTN